MRKHCGNCANYDRRNKKFSELCGKCVVEHYPNGKESDPSMYKPMPQTNADRIRAMNDEELADVVVCPHTGNWDLCRDDCKKCRLEWLKEPAEGDT